MEASERAVESVIKPRLPHLGRDGRHYDSNDKRAGMDRDEFEAAYREREGIFVPPITLLVTAKEQNEKQTRPTRI